MNAKPGGSTRLQAAERILALARLLLGAAMILHIIFEYNAMVTGIAVHRIELASAGTATVWEPAYQWGIFPADFITAMLVALLSLGVLVAVRARRVAIQRGPAIAIMNLIVWFWFTAMAFILYGQLAPTIQELVFAIWAYAIAGIIMLVVDGYSLWLSASQRRAAGT
ncbi:hypothetical protein J7J84_01075 [bacterium]|nr:hypothetical protein [bacterium]